MILDQYIKNSIEITLKEITHTDKSKTYQVEIKKKDTTIAIAYCADYQEAKNWFSNWANPSHKIFS